MKLNPLFRRLLANWFLIGLIACLIGGNIFSEPLRGYAGSRRWQEILVACVMFLMALPMEFHVVRRVLRRPAAPLLACLVNLVLAPLLTWPISKLLGQELGSGLIVAAATPCTLASAAVWTRKAGGNDVVAVMVTLLTNLACFWVLPGWIKLLTAHSAQGQNLGATVMMLLSIVVVPIALAQLARSSGWIRRQAARYRTLMGGVCQIGILSIVLVGAVKTAERLGRTDVAALGTGQLVVCIAFAFGLHLCLLFVGWRLARWLGMPPGIRLRSPLLGVKRR